MRPRRPTKSTRVAIVGAGMSGIAMAVKLKKAGYANFEVFEKSGGVGGTWYDSHFPGAAVDTHSYCYSYPFNHYDWGSTHANASQVRAYFDATVDEFEIRDRFHFNSEVEAAVWDPASASYAVRLRNGDVVEFDVIVTGVGILNNPAYPDWPGLERFAGPAFHSARWESHHDLSNKRVAVVGFGSSTAQIVPGLAPNVKELVLFARSPSWVLPKPVQTFSRSQRWRYDHDPLYRLWQRYKIFRTRERSEILQGVREAEGPGQELIHSIAMKHLDVVEDPELRAALTPSFPVGCKRPVLDSNFYPALNRDNVSVVLQGVAAADETGLIDTAGRHHDVDAIVMATGFTSTNFLATMEVEGLDGRSIHDIWGQSPRAFCGLTVPGIPNFFMLYGPNTNGGISLMSNATRQAEAIIATIKRMERRGVDVVDTRRSALQRWIEWVDERNKLWTASNLGLCTNYYISPTGENVTQMPLRYVEYVAALKLLFPRGLVFGVATGTSARGPRRAGQVSTKRLLEPGGS